jgi:hypothetical protein
MTDSAPETTSARLDRIEVTIDRLSNAVDMLVTDFLRPLVQQSVANQEVIAQLTQRMATHAEWLDEDRHDVAEQRQQIQVLIEDARADRKRYAEQFDRQLTKIESNEIESTRRYQAQLEITQAMLVELSTVNRRIETLENAA